MDPSSQATCWTLIRGAAAGSGEGRERFGRRYAAPLRAFFAARWRHSLVSQDVEDALQEVFLECFREGGALDRVEERRAGGFRAFLYGVARNVARRIESRRSKRVKDGGSTFDLDRIEDDGESMSLAFDRAWAKSVMREAAQLQEDRARESGPEAMQRVEFLRLRFGEGLPVREIAKRFDLDDRDAIHREIRRARKMFKEALREVVSFDLPEGTDADVDAECERLQELLEAAP